MMNAAIRVLVAVLAFSFGIAVVFHTLAAPPPAHEFLAYFWVSLRVIGAMAIAGSGLVWATR